MIQNIIKSVLVISIMMCSVDIVAQTQNSVAPNVQMPAYDKGKFVPNPPVMVTGVTLSSPDDPVNIPGKNNQGRAGSTQTGEPIVSLSINVPVIETAEKKQVKGK